jgi:hypothetical protein
MELKIGDVVTTAMPVLGCNPGTRGVVYETYQDFDDKNKKGASIIFENGAYDGFSYEDQQIMLNEEKVMYISFFVREYKFQNVLKLTQDFEKGIWDDIFV